VIYFLQSDLSQKSKVQIRGEDASQL